MPFGVWTMVNIDAPIICIIISVTINNSYNGNNKYIVHGEIKLIIYHYCLHKINKVFSVVALTGTNLSSATWCKLNNYKHTRKIHLAKSISHELYKTTAIAHV